MRNWGAQEPVVSWKEWTIDNTNWLLHWIECEELSAELRKFQTKTEIGIADEGHWIFSGKIKRVLVGDVGDECTEIFHFSSKAVKVSEAKEL